MNFSEFHIFFVFTVHCPSNYVQRTKFKLCTTYQVVQMRLVNYIYHNPKRLVKI